MNKINRLLATCIWVLFCCSRALGQSSPNSTFPALAERLGYPANSRLLVIHADDFGMSHSVNRAIMEALDKHWVTSASIMVPCPWFPEAAHWAHGHPDADIGLHLTLNSDWTGYRWGSVSAQTKGSSLFDAEGYLPLTTENVVVGARTSDVEVEARAQIEKALSLGIHLTHMDPHMGTMTSTSEMSKVYFDLGVQYRLPILLQRRDIGIWNNSQIGIKTKHYGTQPPPQPEILDAVLQIMPGVKKSEWFNAYKTLLEQLAPGAYELIVHLGYDDPEMQGATAGHTHWGSEWRQNDLDLVRSVEFQQFLKDQKFVLISWKDLARANPARSDVDDSVAAPTR